MPCSKTKKRFLKKVKNVESPWAVWNAKHPKPKKKSKK